MNFRRGRNKDDAEINLIPLIDVLLVIIIFLMLTTTFSKFSGLEISLPTTDAAPTQDQPNEINVTITAAGEIQVNRKTLAGREQNDLVAALRQAAPASGKAPLVVINGDAKANFQSVFDVMQAAQKAGLPNVSFAAQAQGGR